MHKAISALSLSALTLFAVACGGTAVPPSAVDNVVEGGGVIGGVTGGGGGAVASGNDALVAKDFTINPAVYSNSGSTDQSNPSKLRGSGSGLSTAYSRVASKVNGEIGGAVTKNSGTGGSGTGSGSNGNDIVDLKGDNLAAAGFTKPVTAVLVFLTQGSNEVLGQVNFNGTEAIVEIGGKDLGAGQNLVVEISANSEVTRAILPSSFFTNGGDFGFNAILRTDGSMVLEIFPDSAAPIGQSDNGSRVIVDTAVDCRKNGQLSTVARLETPDGLILFDSNLDGNFGSPEDACILFDTNDDGNIDAADTPVSYAVDPNLDGTTNPGETRLLGNNIPEDFINGLNIAYAPANPVGNGLSTITLGVDFLAAPDGNPIGATIELEVVLRSGTLNQAAEDNAIARWVESGQPILQRTLDPNNANISVLANGSMRLLEALRVPVLDTAGELAVTLRYIQSDRPEGVASTKLIPIRKNEAPSLSSVSYRGTKSFAGLLGGEISGLEGLSRYARVVYGSPVDLIGSNFASAPGYLPSVSFGGVSAVVDGVSEDGTRIFTSVPEGAQSGKIAVLQNGIGAQTSQPFIIAGEPLRVKSVMPADGANNIDVTSPIVVRFNRPISSENIADGFSVFTDAGVPIAGNTEVSEDGLTLTHTPNGMLPASTTIVVRLTGALQTIDGVPFDTDVTDEIFASASVETVISTFQSGATAASDMISPTFDAPNATLITPMNGIGGFSMTLPFSEAIAPGTLFTSVNPVSSDSIRLRSNQTSALVALAVTDISPVGDVITVNIIGPLLGRKGYTLELSPTITDFVGNPITGTLNRVFTTALRIDRMSSVSGPVGTRILIEGSTFDALASNIGVTFAGTPDRVPALIIEASEGGVEVEVPAGAVDGPIEVSVASEAAFSPRPFTVTSAGFEPRIIAQSVGAFGIAIDVEGRGVVSYQGSGQIGFIDVPSEREIPVSQSALRLSIGGVPTEAVLNRSGTLAFTTNFGNPSVVGESIFVIDVNSRAVLSTVRVGRRPTRVAVSPDDRRLYVTNNLDDSVSVVDLSSLLVIGEVKVGAGPNGVAVSPDNKRAYVCNYLEETVTIFDTTTLNVVGTVVVGKSPARVMISPDASRIFVTNNVSNTITIIDAATLAILQELPGFSGPSAMVFDPNGARFFVTNRNSNTIQEVVQDGADWKLGENRIATESVPAGLVITSDGSLLAYTTEGAGKVSVVTIGDPRMTITSLHLNANDAPGRRTLSVDRAQKVWIKGRGLGSSNSNLRVELNGKKIDTFSAGFNSRQVQVFIPGNAESGPLIVSRQRSGTNIVSNDIALLVTNDIPRVISMIPGDGSRGVPRDATIVLEMSEPLDLESIFAPDGSVLGPADLPVLRVMRLDDNGGAPVNVSGNWTADEFGRRFEFARPNDPDTGLRREFFEPESNNIYEVVMSPRVHDLFGRPVEGAITSFGSAADTQLGSTATAGNSARALGFRGRFITVDERGPHIRQALYRDVNGDGPGAGDEIEVEFDEELLYGPGTFGTGGFSLLGQILFSNGLPGATLSARPGSSPRRVILTLGAGAELTFGGGGTTLNAVPSTQPSSISAFTDYSQQRPTAGSEVPVVVDDRYDNQQAPRLLFAHWNDVDTSGSASAGDEVVLEFSEAVHLGGAATVANLLSISNGDLGDATIAPQSGDLRRVRVVLGGASSFTANASVITLTDAGLGFVAADTVFDLLGNLAHGGDASMAVVSDTAPVDATLNPLVKPLHIDVAGTGSGLDEGDVIIVTFSAPVRINTNAPDAEPSKRFRLGVAGDRFGSGARLEQPAFVTPRGQAPRLIAPNEIVIRLGKLPIFRSAGEFGIDLVSE